MTTPRYVSVSTFKDYARVETATADDTEIEAAINAAEQQLDIACQRRFVVATTATARVYAPQTLTLLRIHDTTTVTAVVNNGVTVAATDYQLEPVNGLTWAGEPVPYTQIRLLGTGEWDFGDFDGKASISVTGTWGWAAIPAPIVEACKVLAKDILGNRDVRFGLVAVTEAAGISARTNPIVRTAIDQYRRQEAFGIA